MFGPERTATGRPCTRVERRSPVSGSRPFARLRTGAPPLSAVVRSDDERVLRAARVAFAFVLAIDVLLVASAYDLTNTSPSETISSFEYQTGRSFWWLIAVAGGVPIALIFGVAVRRAYAG